MSYVRFSPLWGHHAQHRLITRQGERTPRQFCGDLYGSLQRPARRRDPPCVRQQPLQLLLQWYEEGGTHPEQATGEADMRLAPRRADRGRGLGHVPGRLAQDPPGHGVAVGAGRHLGCEGGEHGRPVTARVEPAGQLPHRSERLLGPDQQHRRAPGPPVVGTQGGLKTGPPDPRTAPAVAQQMTPAVRPAPGLEVGADRDETGTGGDDRTRARSEGAGVGGHRVRDERDGPHPELPLQRDGKLGPQGIAQARETGRPDDGGAEPAHPRFGQQRADHGHQLLHQMPRIDAARPRPDRHPRLPRGRGPPAGGADDRPQAGAAGVDGEEPAPVPVPLSDKLPAFPVTGRTLCPAGSKVSTGRKSNARGAARAGRLAWAPGCQWVPVE